MTKEQTVLRFSILTLAFLFVVAVPVPAGGIAIVSTSLTDNGDGDGFADSRETVTLFLTVRNTSGMPLTNVIGTIYALDPYVACTSKPQIVIGDLAVDQTVTTIDGFQFTVSDIDRTTLGLGPFDLLGAEFRVYFDSDSGSVSGYSPRISLDLDLDVTGGSGTATYREDFESMTLGTLAVENLDAGLSSLAASDGYRCQYNDPDNPNGNSVGRAECHLAPNPAHADATWWALSGPSFSPAGGRGFSGFHSAVFGVDLGPPENWTTPLGVLEAITMIDPVHIGRDAIAPTLTFKQQVSFADGRDFSLPLNETYDRGVVMAQVADDAGNPAGPWIKLDPYQNPYDQQQSPRFITCQFDPIDDGNTEDDFFAPGDPQRLTGPSSMCYPEFIYANIGETSNVFNAANVGKADGPGLQGLWGIGTWVESKADLSRFRGRSVRVRFLAGTMEVNGGTGDTWDAIFGGINPTPGDDGWWIDDIEIDGLIANAATVAVDDKDNSGLPGPSGVDVDVDGLIDTCDNCPLISNPAQLDGDTDTFGDVCDSCPFSADNSDPDLDQVCGAADNCPNVANPTQTNADGDDFGTACDCNDLDASINPDGVETNNAIDEDCDGVVDELSGVTATKNGSTTTFDWPVQDLASSYQLARSSSPEMNSDCENSNLFSYTYDETRVPPSGDVWFFVFRARWPNPGSWGLDSGSIERTGTCLP